jgi:hypothetical protein
VADEPPFDSRIFEQIRYCDMCDQATAPTPTERGDMCSNCSCYYEPPTDG